MSTDRIAYIVVSEYDERLAKRQPWYTVRFLHGELTERNYEVKIVSSLSKIPPGFRGKVVKLISLKDFFFGAARADRSYQLVYLCTLPIYRASDILRCGMRTVLLNFKDLWRLFIVSLLPRFWIRSVLSGAEQVVFLSDVRLQQFRRLPNATLMIPFIQGNWPKNGYVSKPTTERRKLAYIGPPFETRGIDIVANYSRHVSGRLLKLIIRLERDELRQRFSQYKSYFANAETVSGMLNREELLGELNDCAAAILPFKVVMSECPIVALEAIELGIPLITTSECGVASLGNFPGVILDRKFDLAQAVSQLENMDSSQKIQKSKRLLEKIDSINREFFRAHF